MVDFNEEKQNRRVSELHKKEEEELQKILSEKYGIRYADLSSVPINIEALRILSLEESQEGLVGVFDKTDKNLKVAVKSPRFEKTKDLIEELKKQGYDLTLFMVSEDSLKRIWNHYEDLSQTQKSEEGGINISGKEIISFIKTEPEIEDIKKNVDEIISQNEGFQTSKVLEIILAGALSVKASDIHLEPEEDDVRLRYRLDGILTDIFRFNHKIYKLILSRVKLLSGLRLNITGDAQDGRFSIDIEDKEIEIRTSILPGAYNDSIVLRVLDPDSLSVPLEEMGMDPRFLELLTKEIHKPNGMILTTGPTGSGKTTTLYSSIKKIHTPDIKIVTIENPIEYHLEGIVQTQTSEKAGYTFLSGLRSALRQDPDVIMVGEIRDNETATIAINAALTGHLVFSTLHTNDAAGAFPRLIDLGVNPKVITSALNLAMAQRLVRRLCEKCKKEITPQGRTKELLQKISQSIEDKSYLENLNKETIWIAQGCESCHNTGYKGRIGIFEAIKTNEKIERLLKNNPSAREIKDAAHDQNIPTLRQDGVLKVMEGLTSFEELERVIDVEKE